MAAESKWSFHEQGQHRLRETIFSSIKSENILLHWCTSTFHICDKECTQLQACKLHAHAISQNLAKLSRIGTAEYGDDFPFSDCYICDCFLDSVAHDDNCWFRQCGPWLFLLIRQCGQWYCWFNQCGQWLLLLTQSVWHCTMIVDSISVAHEDDCCFNQCEQLLFLLIQTEWHMTMIADSTSVASDSYCWFNKYGTRRCSTWRVVSSPIEWFEWFCCNRLIFKLMSAQVYESNALYAPKWSSLDRTSWIAWPQTYSAHPHQRSPCNSTGQTCCTSSHIAISMGAGFLMTRSQLLKNLYSISYRWTGRNPSDFTGQAKSERESLRRRCHLLARSLCRTGDSQNIFR